MVDDKETTPQRARRLGREYAKAFHGRWSAKSRHWITFAYARGYEQACKDIDAEAAPLDVAIIVWEDTGNAEKLAERVDAFLASLEEKVGAA